MLTSYDGIEEEIEDEEVEEEEEEAIVSSMIRVRNRYDNKTFLSTELSRLVRIKRTQVEMIMDRGYNIDDDSQYLTIDNSQFYEKFKDFNAKELFSSISKIYDNKICVFYPIPTNKQLSANDITAVFQMIEKQSPIRHFIVISETQPSPELKKQIINIESKNLFPNLAIAIRIEIFKYTELIFNVTKHFLASKQRILSDEEKEEVSTQVNINDLPQSLETDMHVRYLGGRRGQLIEVKRRDINPYSDSIIDKSLIYRLIVPDNQY